MKELPHSRLCFLLFNNFLMNVQVLNTDPLNSRNIRNPESVKVVIQASVF